MMTHWWWHSDDDTRVIDHSGSDDKSHLHEHAEITRHENVGIDNFEILSNGYKNNKFKTCRGTKY